MKTTSLFLPHWQKGRLREREGWVAILLPIENKKNISFFFLLLFHATVHTEGKAMHHVYLHCSIPNIHLLGHNNKNALDHPLYWSLIHRSIHLYRHKSVFYTNIYLQIVTVICLRGSQLFPRYTYKYTYVEELPPMRSEEGYRTCRLFLSHHKEWLN